MSKPLPPSALPDLNKVAEIACSLQDLQSKALAAGLFITARKINWAIQSLGWEATGDLGRAARGVRT